MQAVVDHHIEHFRSGHARGIAAEYAVDPVHVSRLNIVRDTGVGAYHAVAGAQFQLVQPADVFQPVLFVHRPADADGRERSVATVDRKARRSVGTHRGGYQVFVVIVVIDASQIRKVGETRAAGGSGQRRGLSEPGVPQVAVFPCHVGHAQNLLTLILRGGFLEGDADQRAERMLVFFERVGERIFVQPVERAALVDAQFVVGAPLVYVDFVFRQEAFALGVGIVQRIRGLENEVLDRFQLDEKVGDRLVIVRIVVAVVV